MYKYQVRAAFEPFMELKPDFSHFIVTNIRESESFGTLKTAFAAAAKLVMELSIHLFMNAFITI